jgi:hypothetical protein
MASPRRSAAFFIEYICPLLSLSRSFFSSQTLRTRSIAVTSTTLLQVILLENLLHSTLNQRPYTLHSRIPPYSPYITTMKPSLILSLILSGTAAAHFPPTPNSSPPTSTRISAIKPQPSQHSPPAPPNRPSPSPRNTSRTQPASPPASPPEPHGAPRRSSRRW